MRAIDGWTGAWMNGLVDGKRFRMFGDRSEPRDSTGLCTVLEKPEADDDG